MDDRKKRLLYRATHRGMKETDALIGGFAAAFLAAMTDDDVIAFEYLLDQNDNDLMDWVLERKPVTDAQLAGIIDQLVAYRRTF